jgi:MYXO-CTERM domain-containing protein
MASWLHRYKATMKTTQLLFAAAVLALGGCQEVTVVDDVDLALDWNPITGPTDALHSPYVQGARFAVWVNTTKKQSLRGWHIESGDSSVLAVGGQGTLSQNEESLFHSATAMAAGKAELRVVDSSGDVRHTHEVEVRFPDRIDVLPHGPLLIGRDDVASDEHPVVLQNGTATFLVQYYASGDRLSGHGALESVRSTDIDTHVEKSSFLEDRDWLVVDATMGGVSQELALEVAGTTARMLAVDTVEEADLDHVQLSPEGEEHASDKEWLVVLAEAFDKSARNVYGAEFAFTANDKAQQGFGDLYRYAYADKIPVMLEATHGTHTDGLLIHSSGGFVDSTNRIGCSAAPGAPALPGAGVALMLVVYALARRKTVRVRA